MTKSPPPAGPEAPEATDTSEEPHGSEALAAMKELAEANKRWSPNAKTIATGAAIGVGSAAVVAAMMYWRGAHRK